MTGAASLKLKPIKAQSQQMLALVPVSYARQLTLSRYYVADAIKRNNVVLVGGRKANPWVHLFDDQMNFVTDFDDAHSQAFVGNMHPKPGEEARYLVSYDSNALVGYSVVAYLPNPSRTGNAIILAGTDSDATDAAAEFLTSEADMEMFQNTVHAKTLPLPVLSAAVGSVSTALCACRIFVASQSPKMKVLFLMMGPPAANPYSLR